MSAFDNWCRAGGRKDCISYQGSCDDCRATFQAGMLAAAEIADGMNLVDSDGVIIKFGAAIGDDIRATAKELT